MWLLAREAIEPRAGSVGGRVVDEDDLEAIARDRLAKQRPDARLDVPPWVVHGDDDADEGAHGLASGRLPGPAELLDRGDDAGARATVALGERGIDACLIAWGRLRTG